MQLEILNNCLKQWHLCLLMFVHIDYFLNLLVDQKVQLLDVQEVQKVDGDVSVLALLQDDLAVLTQV
jgi:hypothetical protein